MSSQPRSYRIHPGIAFGFYFLVLASIVSYLAEQFPALDDDRSVGSNLGLFLLININIILVMVLVFLAGKNVFILALDRRRNILGSRLRSRLVAAFLGLSLVPTILLFLVAKGILESVLQQWFSPQVITTVESAMGVAKSHYDEMNEIVRRNTAYLSRQIAELSPKLEQSGGDETSLTAETLEAVQAVLLEKREEYGLSAITLVDRSGRELATSLHPAPDHPMHSFQVSPQGMDPARRGLVSVSPEEFPEGQFLRGYAPVSKNTPLENRAPPTPEAAPADPGAAPSENDSGRQPKAQPTAAPAVASGPPPASARFFVVTDLRVQPEISKQLSMAVSSFDDYRELRTYRRPLASSYLLTLIVVTLLIIFSAVWVGFYLARGLSVPIGLLAQATAEVAHGNLDLQIPEVGDDELSVLVRSFNTMTSDLKRTTGELVQRRRYMETVFASLEVGVISMDTRFRITTMNKAAASILGVDERKSQAGRAIGEVLPSDLSSKIDELGEELFRGSDRLREASVTITSSSQSKHLQLTLSKLTDDQEGSLGAVLLLDDISELVSAQRMTAWREVARRIAHEIKNPLTPIQLNAERMQRKFRSREAEMQSVESIDAVLANLPEDYRLVAESTETIVKQVDNLRNLVNEFSRFARMPKSNPQPASMNSVIEETVAIFRGAHADIEFRLDLSPSLPPVAIDKEQMGRVLVNLFDNAIAAVTDPERPQDGSRPQVFVSSRYQEDVGLVTFTVSDNGTGIHRTDLPRLFEPYFSTKKGGTGLGLAIVSVIIADHNGFIRAKNNEPTGASFSVELPAMR